MPSEILTLSFGRLANYTCTHLWNFQVRIQCSDVHAAVVHRLMTITPS